MEFACFFIDFRGSFITNCSKFNDIKNQLPGIQCLMFVSWYLVPGVRWLLLMIVEKVNSLMTGARCLVDWCPVTGAWYVYQSMPSAWMTGDWCQVTGCPVPGVFTSQWLVPGWPVSGDQCLVYSPVNDLCLDAWWLVQGAWLTGDWLPGAW